MCSTSTYILFFLHPYVTFSALSSGFDFFWNACPLDLFCLFFGNDYLLRYLCVHLSCFRNYHFLVCCHWFFHVYHVAFMFSHSCFPVSKSSCSIATFSFRILLPSVKNWYCKCNLLNFVVPFLFFGFQNFQPCPGLHQLLDIEIWRPSKRCRCGTVNGWLFFIFVVFICFLFL